MRKVFFCVIFIPFFFAAATAQGRQEFRIDDKYVITLEPGEIARYNNQPMTFSVEGGKISAGKIRMVSVYRRIQASAAL